MLWVPLKTWATADLTGSLLGARAGWRSHCISPREPCTQHPAHSRPSRLQRHGRVRARLFERIKDGTADASPSGMSEPRKLRCYAYVVRPYEAPSLAIASQKRPSTGYSKTSPTNSAASHCQVPESNRKRHSPCERIDRGERRTRQSLRIRRSRTARRAEPLPARSSARWSARRPECPGPSWE